MHRCVVEYANLVMKKINDINIELHICKIVGMCRDGMITTLEAMAEIAEIEVNSR